MPASHRQAAQMVPCSEEPRDLQIALLGVARPMSPHIKEDVLHGTRRIG